MVSKNMLLVGSYCFKAFLDLLHKVSRPLNLKNYMAAFFLNSSSQIIDI